MNSSLENDEESSQQEDSSSKSDSEEESSMEPKTTEYDEDDKHVTVEIVEDDDDEEIAYPKEGFVTPRISPPPDVPLRPHKPKNAAKKKFRYESKFERTQDRRKEKIRRLKKKIRR